MGSVASDGDFVSALREAVGRYFDAVDRWEEAYWRYYRLPGAAAIPSSDVQAEQLEFEQCRREFQRLLPRARSLCFRYGQRDAFSGLRYAALGAYAPQQRTDSAIGRAERSAAMACLMALEAACRERAGEAEMAPPTPAPSKTSLLERIAAFFY